jgi:hypothetical protein
MSRICIKPTSTTSYTSYTSYFIGQRPFIKSAVSSAANEGIDHLYGVAFDDANNLYTSSQHTDVVQRFYKDTFEPMPFPPYVEENQIKYVCVCVCVCICEHLCVCV